jgi:hypothetical protein
LVVLVTKKNEMGHEFEFKFFIPCQVTLGAKSNLIVLVTKKNKKKNKKQKTQAQMLVQNRTRA